MTHYSNAINFATCFDLKAHEALNHHFAVKECQSLPAVVRTTKPQLNLGPSKLEQY